MNDIKFIYFDVGGVLIDWSKVFQTAANKFLLTVKDITEVFNENHDAITKGMITSQEFWQKCVKKYGIQNADSFNFVNSWVGDYQQITQTHNLAKKLSINYKIGLLSNIYEGMLPLLIEKQLIPEINYNQIIFSCDVGMMKPNMDIYKLAQEKAGLTGNEILYVDDRSDYLVPARKLKWHTLLFDNNMIEESLEDISKYLQS